MMREKQNASEMPANELMQQANRQVKINPGIYQNNPNQIRPTNNNNTTNNSNNPNNNNFINSIKSNNNNNNMKFIANSPNTSAIEALNMAKSNIAQNRNSTVNPILAMQQQINNNANLVDLSNIKKIEQKRPDRSSNKNTGFQDKIVYMDHVKTDNLNASTAKNLRSSPQIMIRNPNVNSNQKNLIKNNLSNKNQSFQQNNNVALNNQSIINSNLKIAADDVSSYDKNFYKQNLSKKK